MSFYTSFCFARQGKPPIITANELAKFIDRIRKTDFLTEDGLRFMEVKLGKAIDQDSRSSIVEETNEVGITVVGTIEWDVQLDHPCSIDEIVGKLRRSNQHIFRASIALGNLKTEIVQPITRTQSPENEVDYLPHSLSIQIGPIETYDLSSDSSTFAGWLGLGISGPGYLYPWTFEELIRRADAVPEIQQLTRFCQEMWPIKETRTKSTFGKLIEAIASLGHGQNYQKANWSWILQRTG